MFSFSSPPFGALAVFVALAACGPTSPLVEQPDETTGRDTDPSGSTTMTSTTDEPATGTDESTGDPWGNFIEDQDAGGASFECDTWTQDCPAGQKCAFWANDGGGAWNATRCVDIVPDAGEAGESCTVEGSGVSGIDTCDIGGMCWDVDAETNEGYCVELCTGDESSPICTDPEMVCVGRGPFLCLPSCCPVEQDCEEGQGCYPVDHDFQCAPDASGEMGGFRDPCEFINVCDPGLMCINPEMVPGCEGAIGCCTAFCEIGSTSCGLLDPEFECLPWFEEGEAPPGLDHIGMCAVMP